MDLLDHQRPAVIPPGWGFLGQMLLSLVSAHPVQKETRQQKQGLIPALGGSLSMQEVPLQWLHLDVSGPGAHGWDWPVGAKRRVVIIDN